MKSLMRSPELDAALERTVYSEPALVPACQWLDSAPPEKPRLSVAAGNLNVKLSWENAPGEKVALWILQYQRGGTWTTQILPGNRRSHIFDGVPPDALAVSAVDRIGNASTAATLALRK
jgi:hypothetical protein